MNILVLNYEYPPLGGGAGVITQNISERLAGLGHRVTVLTTWHQTEKDTEVKGTLKIIRLKSKRRYTYKSDVFEMLSWINKSKDHFKTFSWSEKFDLCFANFTIPGGIVALNLKNKFALKYVVLSHGHDIPWMFPKQMLFYHLFSYFRIKRVCLESETNIVLTQETKINIDDFLGKKQSSKNIIIPKGTDFTLFKPDYTKKKQDVQSNFRRQISRTKRSYYFSKSN